MAKSLAWMCVSFVLLSTICGGCLGQQKERKWEAFGGVGYSSFGSDDGSFGTGVEWNAGIGRRLFGPIGVQGAFRGAPFSREIPGGCLPGDPFVCLTHRINGRVKYLTGDLVFEPRWSRAMPYFALGGGLFEMDARFRELIPGEPIPYSSHRNQRRDWAVNLAAGLRVFARRDFSVRPEVRFSGSPGYLQARFAILAGYHF